MAMPPAISLSGLRCAANSRNTSDWNLLIGKAKPFDAFREPPSIHVAMRPQCLGDRQSIRGGRVPDRAHVPQRTPALLIERPTVEAREVFEVCLLGADSAEN